MQASCIFSRLRAGRPRGRWLGVVSLAALALTGCTTQFELHPSHAIQLLDRQHPGTAPDDLQAAGRFLAECLAQMTGWELPVVAVTNPSPAGITLVLEGVPGGGAGEVDSTALERYRIRAGPQGLEIAAPTAIGVQHGVTAFLEHQGCRWLIPSSKWWVLPRTRQVRFSGTATSAPAYAGRRLFYAYGPGQRPELADYWKTWERANRLGGARPFHVGHSYGNIVGRNEAEFAAHPEYFAKDEQGHPATNLAVAARKFCYSDPGLRALCVRDRVALLRERRAQNPLEFMVSMDPSDGQGTCHCAGCQALGTTTDRVISLANEVAREIRGQCPGGWVGLYGYSSHRLPPTIAVESNVHVEVAMAFNNTGLSFEQLIEGWGAKAGSIGIREYYAVEAWDWGLPGRMRGANPAYHARTLPFYLAHGARSLTAELNANWGGQALGIYVAARLLWDPTANPDAVREDFLRAAFGAAAPQLGELYAYFEKAGSLGLGPRARMLELALAGLAAADDDACRARIIDVLAYLVYVDQCVRFQRLANDGSETYFTALRELMTYAHRIEDRNVVHTYALARRLCNANVKGRRDELWVSDPAATWKRGAPHTDAEILDLARGLQRGYARALEDRTTYSPQLVLVRDDAAAPSAAPRRVALRYQSTMYLQPLVAGPMDLAVELGEDRQRITGALYPHLGAEAIWTFAATNSGRYATPVPLATGQVYRLAISAGKTTSTVVFPDDVAVAIEASEEQPAWLDGGGPFAVLVPRGTRELRCAGEPRLSLLSPRGARTDITPRELDPAAGFARVPVDAADAGRLWQVGPQTRGQVLFLNVPPLLQLDPRRQLLPPETAAAAP